MRLLAKTVANDDYMGVDLPDGLWVPLAPVDLFFESLEEFMAMAAKAAGGFAVDAPAAIPVPSGARTFCLGLNFADHITETSNARPTAPNVFARWRTSLCPDGSTVRIPVGEDGLDFEGELAVIVQTDENGARPFAYTCFNDVTARRHQHDTSQWTLGKNVDGSGAIGPSLVTADEAEEDLYSRTLTLRLNGEEMQRAELSKLLFKPQEVIDRIGEVTRLRNGDVIALGTPAGVGHVRTPVMLGQPSDVFEVEITGFGTLRTTVGPFS